MTFSSSKRHLALALASVAMLAATGAAHAQNALDNVLKAKTIKIAVPTDYPPYGSVDKNMAFRCGCWSSRANARRNWADRGCGSTAWPTGRRCARYTSASVFHCTA